MVGKTVGLLLFVFVVLAVAWGLTSDPVDDGDREAGPIAAATDPLECTIAGPPAALPLDLHESSGVAVDRTQGVLWSHNDAGGDPILYAVDDQGRLAARVIVEGASNVDWEDISVGPCDDGTCLFIADIGDNDAERDFITIYRVPLPGQGVERVRATPLHARYPDGPRDAEGLISTPDGGLYIVTKGRHGPVQLYQRTPAAGDDVAALRLVTTLGPEPERGNDRVSAATATPDGRWVAIRTYNELRVYDAAALRPDGPGPDALTFDLRPLAEPQGEGLDMADDGTVWLTSEADGDAPPSFSRLACTLPASGDAS